MTQAILLGALLGAAIGYAITPNSTTLTFLIFVTQAAFVIWLAERVARRIRFQ